MYIYSNEITKLPKEMILLITPTPSRPPPPPVTEICQLSYVIVTKFWPIFINNIIEIIYKFDVAFVDGKYHCRDDPPPH